MTKSEFEQLQGAYKALGVLARLDLERFCKAYETTAVIGDRDLAYLLEGRRQVWLRIYDFINKSTEELVEKYTRPATEER